MTATIGGSQPEFIDNRDGNTLVEALGLVLGDSVGGMAEGAPGRPSNLVIAAAFFSPTGLSNISRHLEGLDRVRLLFGVEAPRDIEIRRPDIGEPPTQFEARLVREGLQQSQAAARAARDRFPFTREGIAALRRLVERLRAENIEVRRYERTFMHAKAYIFTSENGVYGAQAGVIAGSSNLTGGGLARNLELNLGRYDDPVIRQACDWFDALWEEAESVDLAALYEEIFAPYTPWEIFLRILFQLYGGEIAELAKEDGGLPLTSFQTHGVARALRLIRDCGGAIVADEVGLGKSFIAAEVVRVYHANRQRALLICPAQLRDTTWKKFLARHRLEISVECLSFEELANDVQLRDPRRPGPTAEHLERPLHEYQLVVVDEAHNYRNPDAPTRAAVLRRPLFGQRRDLLLLTATPVNNSLWDIFHLIRFFVGQDAFLAGRGVLSIQERFQHAMRQDPSDLSPDLLYPIIDTTCVKRTRQFVNKHYAGDTIIGPDGQRQAIIFPKPQPITVRYALDDPLPALFDEIEIALDPDGHPGALTFSRYGTDAFRRGGRDSDDDAQLAATVGLIRSALLKRFESSPYAFQRTLDTLIAGHAIFLDALDKGRVVSTRFLREFGADDEAALEDLLLSSPDSEPTDLFDVVRLKRAVVSDLAILRSLAASAALITPEHDPQLKALVRELEKIAAQAVDEGLDIVDEAQKRKVILFSFFSDTVKYVRDFVAAEADHNRRLRVYRGRIAAVTGGDDLEEFSRQDALYGFAPISAEAPQGRHHDLCDILVSTDVLAEGVNLQQCRHIINFDVPWNPMRLVQRHGRIDRIGSTHPRVFLRTIFPAERLDQLLNLEQRILAKIAMAAASIGVERPVAGAAHGEQVFTETRGEIERLLKEDPTLYERGGTAGAAQTGEEYRQTMRKALAENRDGIVDLPWKAGSGMAKGDQPGVLFCAAVGPRTYMRFVRTDGYWRPIPSPIAPETGEPRGTIIESELGTCLRLAECEPNTPRVLPRSLEEDVVFDLWEIAQDDIWHSSSADVRMPRNR